MFLLLNILWLIRTSKFVLFWIYLWQLKEYHVGRFLDHFRTYKGKKLFFNYFFLFKIILLLLFVFSEAFFSIWFSVLFLIYLFESLIFFKQLVLKSFKKPVKTAKTIFLSLISFAVLFLFLFYVSANEKAPVYILLFDILTPVVVSLAVLLVQPFFVIARNDVLKKATKKIEELKLAGSDLVVIGITGSYGKTSTKEFLAAILSEKFKVLNTKQHQNSEIAVAKCILNDLKPEHQIFIAEVGAYNKGKVKEVCNMLKPKIGIVTGVNEQHLSLFGSMENLLSAEGGEELAKSLPSDGLLVLNADNKYCLNLYKKFSGKKKIYSLKKDKIDSDI